MQRIGFIVLPGFQMMSVASLSIFEFANKEMGEPVYDVRLLSDTGGLIRSSIGFDVATEPLDGGNFDTVIVGGSAVPGALTPGVIKFLRRASRRSRRRRLHLHRRVRPGRGRPARRPARDHALESGA